MTAPIQYEFERWYDWLLEEGADTIRRRLTPQGYLWMLRSRRMNSMAMTLYGACLYQGIYANQNKARARRVFAEAAARFQNVHAVRYLSYMLEYGMGGPRSRKRSFELLRNFSERGAYVFDSFAYEMGLFYDKGRGTPRDTSKALRWYGIAHRKGRLKDNFLDWAGVNLGFLLAQHSESRMKARFGTQLLLNYARSGDAMANAALGDMLIGEFSFRYPEDCLELLKSRLEIHEFPKHFYQTAKRQAQLALKKGGLSPDARISFHNTLACARSGLRIIRARNPTA